MMGEGCAPPAAEPLSERPPAAESETYRIRSIGHPTAWIAELWLQPVAGRLEYLPGQYVLLEDCVGRVPPRSYSIAHAPRRDGLISLLVTAAGGQTSSWVHEALHRGDEVTVTGPYGTFVADPAATRRTSQNRVARRQKATPGGTNRCSIH